MAKTKLTIELVPRSVSFSNVRTLLPKKEWDRLRKVSYHKAKHKCEICGQDGKTQGFRHFVECHEIWEYNKKTKTQRLDGLVSLCPLCHLVKHFGRTTAIGWQDKALTHLENVNEWSHKETVEYLAEVYETQKQRSKCKWKLDVSVLGEVYGVREKLITEAHKKRS